MGLEPWQNPNYKKVFLEACDICNAFGRQSKQKRVRWCNWKENKKRYSGILCKPCFTSLNKIKIDEPT